MSLRPLGTRRCHVTPRLDDDGKGDGDDDRDGDTDTRAVRPRALRLSRSIVVIS